MRKPMLGTSVCHGEKQCLDMAEDGAQCYFFESLCYFFESFWRFHRNSGVGRRYHNMTVGKARGGGFSLLWA